MATLKNVCVKIIILPIKLYKILISPLLGRVCRFYPSCADYSLAAFEQHGVIKGVFLTFTRICRCQPWSRGGIDPVPAALNFKLRKKACFQKSEDI